MNALHSDRRRRRSARAALLAAAAATLTAAAATMAGGCRALESLAASAGQRPTATVAGVRLTELSMDGATLAFDVRVTNPYGTPLPLTDLEYRVASDGQAIATGTAAPGGSIPASGSRTVALPARIEFAEVLRTLDGVRPGALVPYDAELTLAVDAPAVGRIALPLRRSGELPVPAVPEVSIERIEWDALTLDEARARLHLGVRNTNQFRVDLPSLDAGLSLGGQRVGETRLSRPLALGAGDAAAAEIPFSFSPARFGVAAFRMLTGSSGDYALDGRIVFDTPFGRIDAPLRASGTTSFVR